MSKDEALKLALEALEEAHYKMEHYQDEKKREQAITAIKQALAAPNLQAELDATNRQVEILSDALAESRREIDAMIAGALFDFMGWLTSRDQRLTLSSTDEASPAVEAITEFAKMRGLLLVDARVQDWQDTTPPAAQRQHLTDGSLCWCEPETSYTDPETGASVVVHKGPQ
jgi:hypothetical protein